MYPWRCALVLAGCSRLSFAQRNPFLGKWQETGGSTCDLSELNGAENQIAELHFQSGDEFSVTWHPFETYRDYWGTYTYHASNGTITFTVTAGNDLPEFFDGTGEYQITDDGLLILSDLFLGSVDIAVEAQPVCDYEFSSYE